MVRQKQQYPRRLNVAAIAQVLPYLLQKGLFEGARENITSAIRPVLKKNTKYGMLSPPELIRAEKNAKSRRDFDAFQAAFTDPEIQNIPKSKAEYYGLPGDFDTGVLSNPGVGPDPWQLGWSKKVGGPTDFGPPDEKYPDSKNFPGSGTREGGKIHSSIKYRKY